jgi:Fic family protein
MVYIYKKTIGGKQYYYLRASQRKNERIIVKDIAYLGNNLNEVKQKLDNLPSYSPQIRKAYRTIHNFLESNLYLQKAKSLKLKKNSFLEENLYEVEAIKLHYNTIFKKKDRLTKNETLKNFIIEFAFNTTSIEGNTIKLKEARNLIEENLTPKGKTLREIYDIQNTEKAFFWISENIDKINIDNNFIQDVHKKLMKNIDVRNGYRTEDVRVLKSNFEATPAPYVKTDMDLLLEYFNQSKSKLHPLVLATAFHHKFEKIHPFMDGNGRTGRMLLNTILMKENYPPTIIHKKLRLQYLDALRKADRTELWKTKEQHYQQLAKFIASEMSETYWNIFL